MLSVVWLSDVYLSKLRNLFDYRVFDLNKDNKVLKVSGYEQTNTDYDLCSNGDRVK